MQPVSSYQIFPLGDSAITLDFGNVINEAVNRKVTALFLHLQKKPFDGIIEAIPAYSSLSIYFDVISMKKKVKEKTVYEWMKQELERILKQDIPIVNETTRLVRIPVCYEKELSPDLESLAFAKNLNVEEVIRLHTSRTYLVYMLGFLPGFSYMGEVDERIETPRKLQPVPVVAGSVGIAGKQTGIYPLESPGGWQIIGRTPMKIFDAGRENAILLGTGDEVQFYSISKDEYENYQSRNS